MIQSNIADESRVKTCGLRHRWSFSTPSEGTSPSKTRHIVVLVHGRAGNDSLMWVFAKAFHGKHAGIRRTTPAPFFIAPQAPSPDPIGGFSWWNASHEPNTPSPMPLHTTWEELSKPVQLLKSFVEAVPKAYSEQIEQTSSPQIIGLGFSQGAALVASLAVEQPTLFAGVALLSGCLPRVMTRRLEELDGKFPKFFIAHGAKDETIPFARAEETATLLRNAGAKVEFCAEEVGHKTGNTGVKALARWHSDNFGT